MPNDILRPANLVDNPDAFQKMLGAFKWISRLAVDTESNSLFAYDEQICLIQFSTEKVDYLVDTLVGFDVSGLKPVFVDPKVEKIFHAAEYDILCMKRDYGFEFANLFDTMQAARVLGIEKLGLANLLADLFEVDHPKALQKADWSKRPLTPEMCAYARMDTHYLMRLRDTLAGQLTEKNLLDLAHEDFNRLCQVEPNHKSKVLFTQVSGYHKLEPRTLRILDELCCYRDGLARKMDRPHFKVMGNSVLLAVALAQPQTIQALKKVDDVSPKILERFGEELVAAVKRGLVLPPIELEKRKRPAQEYDDRLQALQDWRKEAAGKMKVQSDIILPRDVLEQIAATRPRNLSDLKALMLSIPWRFSQFGGEILKVVAKGKPS
ncbi:MAG: HRDC domain-containing protein [Pelolinea sp.]|nr:HRDC domain-containing protein [Pelolinea sp.]